MRPNAANISSESLLIKDRTCCDFSRHPAGSGLRDARARPACEEVNELISNVESAWDPGQEGGAVLPRCCAMEGYIASVLRQAPSAAFPRFCCRFTMKKHAASIPELPQDLIKMLQCSECCF